MGVKLALRHRWTGWDEQGRLRFQTPDGPRAVETHATVLALGGASWPRLGSDGAWAETLAAKGVKISPLRPANSGFTVAWSDIFRDRFEGQPLKGVALTFGEHSVRGEAIVTRTGIEGGAVYALSAELREAILRIRSGDAAHRPAARSRDRSELIAKMSAPKGKQSLSNFLRKAVKSLARCDRLAAGGRQGIRHVAGVAVAGRSRQLDQRRPDRTHRRRADRARDLDRGRDSVRANSMTISCSAACPACLRPARCWIGKRRPAAICCRRRLRRGRRRGGVR